MAIGAAAVVIVVLAAQVLGVFGLGQDGTAAGTGTTGCTLKASRQDQAATLAPGGAAIVYERNGGGACVGELYAIYPDGRITADNGAQTVDKQATAEEVTALLTTIEGLGWFTDDMYSTSHTPCGQCYTYFTGVTLNDQSKTV